MQLADPDQFEANIFVTELDVFSIKIGGDATVSIDALSGLSFPAKITAIAPLATVSQGVVSYEVTVELTSLQPSIGMQSATTWNLPHPVLRLLSHNKGLAVQVSHPPAHHRIMPLMSGQYQLYL
jgi:hypothetical protein